MIWACIWYIDIYTWECNATNRCTVLEKYVFPCFSGAGFSLIVCFRLSCFPFVWVSWDWHLSGAEHWTHKTLLLLPLLLSIFYLEYHKSSHSLPHSGSVPHYSNREPFQQLWHFLLCPKEMMSWIWHNAKEQTSTESIRSVWGLCGVLLSLLSLLFCLSECHCGLYSC